ncbi:MAG: efflux RND transporter permease subunit, partial [Bacteroidales bacterium]|nr:efflux RND transporter permease subunit [Bacteroidales bacterium]
IGEIKIFDIAETDQIKAVVMKSGGGNIWEMLDETFISKENSRIPVREFLRETFTEDFQTVSGNITGEIVPVELKVDKGKESKAMESVGEAVKDNGDFDVSFNGSWFSGKRTASELVVALAIALMILYLILASQFESLKQPLIILSEVVIDFFVVFVFLWIAGISLNVMTMIGLIVTSGIVINDSILKVDTINKLILSGKELEVAIREAGQRRLKSIIMTSLTTILAVLPFLGRSSLGDYLQYPMSVVIIVGMVVGTFVSIFIVPALYRALYGKL